MAYLGNAPGVESQRLTTTFTATDGQTAFNPVGGYTLGYVDAYLNGVKLIDGTDYTAADGVTVTLSTGAALNDNVELVTYTPRGLSDGYTKTEADGRYVQPDDDVTLGDVTVDAFTSTGIDDNATSTAITIDANENVGIGTASPETSLHIDAGTGVSSVKLDGNGTGAAVVGSTFGSLYLGADVDNENTASYITFENHGTERARIDSSGNLLVGKTINSTSTTGHGFTGSGLAYHVRSGGEPLLLNRLASDGEIINLRKDGTTVGSIATQYGNLVVSSGDSGLLFYEESPTSTQVLPCKADGTVPTNDINLGNAGRRFKDLYLSGGVYLGGTGAANKLDDYEEGNFTPNDNNISYTSPIGRYERIGRVVHVRGFFAVPTNTNGNDADISLPFTYNEAGTHYITCVVETTDGSLDIKGRFDGLGAGSQNIHIVTPAEARVSLATLSGKQIRFRATYTTA